MTIAGIPRPDSRLAQEATTLVRDAADDLVFNHSSRVYYFAALRGEKDALSYDPELLYVGAMFHDLGLTERYMTSDQRFEIDAADEAYRFLKAHGILDDQATTVWQAIALHTTPEIPLHMGPEVALVTRGVEMDVMGLDFDVYSEAERSAVTDEFPRPNFKEGVIDGFYQGLKHRSHTVFGNVKSDVLADKDPNFVRENFVDKIRGSQWPE